MKETQRMLILRAKRVGLEVELSNPGNGQTRYHFTLPNGTSRVRVGFAQADSYLSGYVDSVAQAIAILAESDIPDKYLQKVVGSLTPQTKQHQG